MHIVHFSEDHLTRCIRHANGIPQFPLGNVTYLANNKKNLVNALDGSRRRFHSNTG